MPAREEPIGTFSVTNITLGEEGRPQGLNVPNWSSTNHTVQLVFSDFTQDSGTAARGARWPYSSGG